MSTNYSTASYSITKKVLCVLLIAIVVVTGIVPIQEAAALTKITTNNIRIAGPDRYGTSFAVADRLFQREGTFDSVIVAYGEVYTDALSGSYLAKVKDAPILLVNSSNEDRVLTYIKSHMRQNGTVYILGGTKAIGDSFQQAVENANLKYKRLWGESRYDTNLEVLKEAGTGAKTVLICSGKNYPDAISASAVGLPILLVNNTMTEQQKEYIKTINPSKIYIIGGSLAVSTSVFNAANRIAPTTRLGGFDRYETSAIVAKNFFEGKTAVALARGDKYPDALSGAPLAMSYDVPLILVGDRFSAGYVNSIIQSNSVKTCYVFGGEQAVATEIVNQATTTYTSYINDTGKIGSKGTAQDVLNVMRSWIGYTVADGRHREIIDIYNSVLPHPVGFKMPYTEAWCDACVTAAAIKAGCSDLVGRECGVERHVKIFKNMGIWNEDGTIVPRPGDIIVYNWNISKQPNNGVGHHIGYVEAVANGMITTIEGNYKNSVRRRYIPIGWGYIRGYARPKYPTR